MKTKYLTKKQRHRRNMKIWFYYKKKKMTRNEIYRKMRINYSIVNRVISDFHQGRYPLKERISENKVHKNLNINKIHRLGLSKTERKRRHNARHLARYAVNTGKIRKGICFCGDKKVEGHHEDYSKPFEVMWLCKKHHIEADNDLKKLTNSNKNIVRHIIMALNKARKSY